MSTEIKNTLFRFVTMRAPELVDERKGKRTFVRHPDLGQCFYIQYFDDYPTISKKVTLKNASAYLQTLNTTFKNREDVQSYTNGSLPENDFFEFATWLTANRTKFTLEELDKKINFHNDIRRANPLQGIDFEKKVILWDNLIYQIVTSKSSYIREAILSILVADLFLNGMADAAQDIKALQRLAQARIIMPKEIFAEEVSIASPALKEPAKTITELAPSKTMEITLINNHLLLLKNLKEEISRIEKRHVKEIGKDLAEYQKQHEIAVEKAYDNTEKIEKTVIDPITKQETIVFEYKDLKLPKFDFIPEKSEIEFLKTHTKNAPFLWIIESCQKALGYDTFAEMIDFAKEKEQILTQMLFERTAKSQKYKSSNGILFPIVENIEERSSNAVSLHSTVAGGKKKLVVEFTGMESGTSISYANYTLRFEDGDDHHGTSKISNWVNGKLQVTLFVSETIAETGGNFRLEASLITQNAKDIFVEAAGVSIRRNIKNSNISDSIAETTFSELVQVDVAGTDLPSYVLTGSGNYTYDEKTVTEPETPKPETPETGNTTVEYIPSGFGIRRLGIADYRKVEQEVCCYVPGEVSHIENVMASEYKERSTRRLRRTEDTTTTSKEKESEKLTDSTSTDRFEMNSEVASILAEDSHVGGYASMNAEYPKIKLSAGADFANNTSSEESNSQAVTHAKEITERVLDRVVQKVKEERISKVIEEFEENNKHGYDNRKNDQHVSGVYRWVDKIYKNKIINYGKRLMYEFMIPEPAAFHKMAITENSDLEEEFIEKPIDPRIATSATSLKLDLNFDNRYKNWLELYNIEIDEKPLETIYIGKSFSYTAGIGLQNDAAEIAAGNEEVKIPEGYQTATTKAAWHNSAEPGLGSGVLVGGIKMVNTSELEIKKFTGSIPVSYSVFGHHSGSLNVEIKCTLTPEAKQQWQIETFNAIIKAYEAKLEEYNAERKESKAIQVEKLRTNPLFYRQIENMVLRKNCIEYLVSHIKLGEKDLVTGSKLNALQVKYDDVALDEYAAKVKFLEQAFEWDLMSYNFYPFYWAYKEKWLQLYNVDETDDAIFRAFLQSGMARVILTIRPGFEEAVNWFMATGQVWNGGQVPTMDDELFISIVDELRETEGEVEETWETRVPTSLTIIQAGSIGMEVATALPCDEDCKDFRQFDSDGNPKLDAEGKQISTNPFQIIKGLTLKGNTEEIIN